MTNKIKRLMIVAGLVTGVMIVTLMHSDDQVAASIELSSTYNIPMIKQVVIQKGSQLIIQATHKLQTN